MATATEQTVPQSSIDELQDQLNAYMERKGLRSTSQRRLVSKERAASRRDAAGARPLLGSQQQAAQGGGEELPVARGGQAPGLGGQEPRGGRVLAGGEPGIEGEPAQARERPQGGPRLAGLHVRRGLWGKERFVL